MSLNNLDEASVAKIWPQRRGRASRALAPGLAAKFANLLSKLRDPGRIPPTALGLGFPICKVRVWMI